MTFSRDASDRLNYENSQFQYDQFFSVVKTIEKEFTLTGSGEPILGPDQIVWQAVVDGFPAEFGWDIWSGFCITAVNKDGEPTIRRMGEFLNDFDWSSKE